uniref:Uncharacterized protein n=1 Tax=Phytophthora ramorum TaxID=164328 RepID=H3HCP4_PHYRM
MPPYKSGKKDSIRSAEVQASNQQWDYAAPLGALSAFGAASYGMLRNHWERNNLVQDVKERRRKEQERKERSRIQRERKERERLENEPLFQVAATGILLALVALAWKYVGWLYFLLAVVIVTMCSNLDVAESEANA